MSPEKLALCNSLEKEIKDLKIQLEIWRNGTELYTVNVKDVLGYNKPIKEHFVDFKVLKILTISEIEKRLAEKETEFNNL